MTTPTLTEFLLARIAEDETNIDGDWSGGDGGLHIISTPMHDRLLAECEAKRRIVELRITYGQNPPINGDRWWSGRNEAADAMLRLLALPHADHPDYDEAWRQ